MSARLLNFLSKEDLVQSVLSYRVRYRYPWAIAIEAGFWWWLYNRTGNSLLCHKRFKQAERKTIK